MSTKDIILVDIKFLGDIMREKILTMLRVGNEISGEAISKDLQISRAAVGKHIQVLRGMGYEISATPSRGYQLLSVPDILNETEIKAWLPADTPWRIENHDALISTNLRLRELAAENAPEFQIVIAEAQSGGQGRLGRSWFSPAAEGLLMSALFRPDIPPESARLMTLTAAVSIAKGLENIGIPVGIKWPNDILSKDGKKLCGIRCEMHADMDKVHWLIMGTGININNTSFPAELADTACSLWQITGKKYVRAEIAAAVLKHLFASYQLLLAGNFGKLQQEWLARAVGLGQQVCVNNSGNIESGIALDLDEDGYLLLKTTQGIKKIIAGDMTINV